MHMHRSLPHRQLRNAEGGFPVGSLGSLPHRQLRKTGVTGIKANE